MNLGRRNKVKVEASMASMTDLIFLMMIFFIIMSTMSNKTLPVDLPSNDYTDPSSKTGVVEVGITGDNKYFFTEDAPENYTMEEMIPILEQKMADSGQDGLKISGDKTANYESIFLVIALAKQKGWKPVLSYAN